MNEVIVDRKIGEQNRAILKALNSEDRAREIGKALILYERALIDAFEQADKLDALGFEQIPWLKPVRIGFSKDQLSKYGSWCAPGPPLRLQTHYRL